MKKKVSGLVKGHRNRENNKFVNIYKLWKKKVQHFVIQWVAREKRKKYLSKRVESKKNKY